MPPRVDHFRLHRSGIWHFHHGRATQKMDVLSTSHDVLETMI